MRHSYFPHNINHLDERISPYIKDGDNETRAHSILSANSTIPFSVSNIRSQGLSIVVLNLDKPDLIIPLLQTLAHEQKYFEDNGTGFQVIIGDTGSTNPTVLDSYRHQPSWVHIISGMKYHFSKSNNHCFANVLYDQVLFMNNDIILDQSPSCLFQLYERMKLTPSIGAQGVVLRFPDNRIQHAGIDFFRSSSFQLFCYHPNATKDLMIEQGCSCTVPAVTGAFLHTRSELFQDLEGFDEIYDSECQDVDLCYKIKRLGYMIQLVEIGIIYHIENATRLKGEENWNDRRHLMRRWSSFLSATYE